MVGLLGDVGINKNPTNIEDNKVIFEISIQI
jgi:hypothetical protein